LAEVDIGPIPDKAVQFVFHNTTNIWGDEPLISVCDVGHGYNDKENKSCWTEQEEPTPNTPNESNLIFDCVDISIREGSRITILGENGSGKTSLERRSSFRSRAGKAYSPRWVDQKHNYQHDNLQQHHNTQGYDTDDKSGNYREC